MRAISGNIVLKLLAILVVLGAAGTYFLLGLRPVVRVETVRRGLAVDAVPGSVVVAAEKDLQELRIELGGRVAWCDPLGSGATFKQGDVLLRLDTSDVDRAMSERTRNYNAGREMAEIRKRRNSELVTAQRQLDNVRRLQKLGDVSEEDVRRAEREVDRIQTELELKDFGSKKEADDFEQDKVNHEITRRKMTVVAPADGAVSAVFVAPGALINAGATVATYYLNERNVVAKVSEEDIAKVKLGNTAKVRLLSYPNQDFDAKVTKILPYADADTRKYTVFLEVKATLEQLRPNSTGEVTITVGEHPDVPLVPRRAVFNGIHVYVVRDGVIEKRTVELGFRGLNIAEIAKGLQPGEDVVVENQDELREGQRVRVLRAPGR